jgi:hypothetical protein
VIFSGGTLRTPASTTSVICMPWMGAHTVTASSVTETVAFIGSMAACATQGRLILGLNDAARRGDGGGCVAVLLRLRPVGVARKRRAVARIDLFVAVDAAGLLHQFRYRHERGLAATERMNLRRRRTTSAARSTCTIRRSEASDAAGGSAADFTKRA